MEGVKTIVGEQGLTFGEATPMIPMRLQTIKGRPINELLDGDIPNWALRREYRSTAWIWLIIKCTCTVVRTTYARITSGLRTTVA